MATLSSSSTFNVAASAPAALTVSFPVLPSVAYPNGKGRLVHPVLGTYDYEYAPDEWLNIDGDVIVTPTWASTKTLSGQAHALWLGNIADVVCEERWLATGGMAMPVTQFRQLLAIMMTPVDPGVGYVQWFPNYTSNISFNVIPIDLVIGTAGSSQLARLSGSGYAVMVLDDVVNYLNNDGTLDGWVVKPATMFLKIVSRVNG